MRQLCWICLLCACYFVSGQELLTKNADLETIRNTKWHQKLIQRGIAWKSFHFEKLFSTKQNVNIIDVDLNSDVRIGFDFEKKSLLKTSDFAKRRNAIAALNGNFFHTREGGSVCFLKVDDKIINQSREDLGEELFLDELDDGAIIILAGGRIRIDRQPQLGWESLQNASTIISSGPLLIYQGKLARQIETNFNNNRFARSGLGLTNDDHAIFITVDGNASESAGISTKEFAQIFAALGCENAINLDGGGSATMFIEGEQFDGIVNNPSDNSKFNHSGERRVANSLIILKSRD